MAALDRRVAGKVLSVGIVVGAVLLAVVVVGRVVRHPQTDDATVMADVINVVPEVAGRIIELHVADNQAVKQGDLLFLIDPRAYEFAVQHGRADVAGARRGDRPHAAAHPGPGVRNRRSTRGRATRRGTGPERRRHVQPPGSPGAAGVRHRGASRPGAGGQAVDGGQPRRGPAEDDAGREGRRRPELAARQA